MIIIPDVHGRAFWKKPVEDNLGKEHIIFLGDYLDPYDYEGEPPWEVFPRFEEILHLKREHPDDITLLLGNHDLHYVDGRLEGGRYDDLNGARNKKMFVENADLFRLVHTTEIEGKKFLFSHAGILAGWMEHNKENLDDATAETISTVLNRLWADKSLWPVLFTLLAQVPFARWGSYRYGSPVWSDENDMLTDAPELPGYYQIFGHSQQEYNPVITEFFACLDCRRAFRLDEGGISELF